MFTTVKEQVLMVLCLKVMGRTFGSMVGKTLGKLGSYLENEC